MATRLKTGVATAARFGVFKRDALLLANQVVTVVARSGDLPVSLTALARSYGRDWPTVTAYGAKAIAFLLTCLVFFLIYRVIPDPPVGTGVAGRAALWAGTGWEAAKYLFVSNLTRANLPAVYGPLAFAVSLVLWAYVSSLVLVFGALMSLRAGAARGSLPA